MNKSAEGDHENLPIAYATAVAPVEDTAFSRTMFELHEGVSGIQLTQSLAGVQIGKVDPNLQHQSNLQPGLFVHSIHIGTDLEVFHLHNNAGRAQSLLDSNIGQIRCLTLDTKPAPVFSHLDGFYYRHTLPTPASASALQIALVGFPPRVDAVSPKSPLAGKLHSQQVIVAVCIPGRQILNASTPGFTGYRVRQELEAYSKIPGIQLVVKDELVRLKNEKGSSSPFDDCVIM